MYGADDHGDRVFLQAVRHPPYVRPADQDDLEIFGEGPVDGGVDLFYFRCVNENGKFFLKHRDHRLPAEVGGMKRPTGAFGLLRDHVCPGFAKGVA